MTEVAGGPVDEALRLRIEELDESGIPIDVRQCYRDRAPGEFVVSHRPSHREACVPRPTFESLIARLERQSWVDSVVHVPPRLYVSPSTSFLTEAIVPAVERGGLRYGWNRRGSDQRVIVSIGCPNTNKPLHIGHLRNCFLGMSLARLFEANGFEVLRTEELSDYGIHICEALAGYLRWDAPTTPTDLGIKGDHFVGQSYSRFHRAHEDGSLLQGGADRDEAAELLRRLESGDPHLAQLNAAVTEWAVAGIRRTYERIGTRHDFVLREWEALPDAMELLRRGLREGAVQRRTDGSWFLDLDDVGLDEATVVRRDGTPLALAQFVAIWLRRAQLHPHWLVMRPTGEEWKRSFEQFREVLRRLDCQEIADSTEGVYYGMVRLPDGRISSRHGGVPLADELIDDVRHHLEQNWTSKTGPIGPYEREVSERLAVAMLKYYILRAKRKRSMVHRPADLWGRVLPELDQILSVLRQAERSCTEYASYGRLRWADHSTAMQRSHRALLLALNRFPSVLSRSLDRRDPAELCSYLLDVARTATVADTRAVVPARMWRVAGLVVRNACQMLDIELPSSTGSIPNLVNDEDVSNVAEVP